jgi:hypothetical protein
MVPGIIKVTEDPAKLAILNQPDGYQQFTFKIEDVTVKYEPTGNLWVKEDGSVYQLPSTASAKGGFDLISIGELVTPSSPATT